MSYQHFRPASTPRPRLGRRSALALGALLLLGTLLLASLLFPLAGGHAHLLGAGPVGPIAPPTGGSGRGGSPATGPAVGTLTVGSSTVQTSPAFFGVVPQTSTSTGIATNSAIGQFLNSTPFTTFRYAMMTDNCNASINVQYGANGQVAGPCATSIPAYKAWCSTHTVGCTTILDLPGENNNSGEDAAIANWIVHTEGFQPTYWSIGNEPELWTHYGKPWTSWSPSDASVPSPMAYAFDLKAAIAAVKQVDPAAKFMGLQADCACSAPWFQDTVAVDGPNLSALAFHTYPSTSLLTSETLQQFYDPLASTANITAGYATARSYIQGHCASCGALPIYVTEYNAGPGWAPSNYAGTFANAVFLAASTVQALLANVTDLMVYNLQTSNPSGYGYSMVNGANTVGPTGVLYSQLLDHLATGVARAAPIAGSPADVWSVVTSNATTESLLVVNSNLNAAVTVAPSTGLPAGNGSIYTWSGAASPTSSQGPLPASVSVPSQGILLVNVPRPSAAPTPLTVQATAAPTAGIAPLDVQFNGTPSGGLPPYAVTWHFGDGMNGSGALTNHTYTVGGNYTATESVVDAAGHVANATVPVQVFPAPQGWFVSAWANVTAGTAPLAAQLSAQAHGGTAPYTYSWDLGNGQNGSGPVLGTTYATPGNFTANVTVTDALGNRTYASVPIFVSAAANGLSAWALASATSGAAPLGVSFVAQSAGSPVPANYTWQLGPGGPTVTGASATYTFAAPGSYPITVTVEGAPNQFVILHMTLTAYAPLLVGLSGPASPVPLGSSVTLAAQVQGGSGDPQFAWTVAGALGNGSGAQLNWTPTAVGNYTFAVIAYDSHGDRAMSTFTIVVGPAPPVVSAIAGSQLGAAAFATWVVALVAVGTLFLALLIAVRLRRGVDWVVDSPRLHQAVRKAIDLGHEILRRL